MILGIQGQELSQGEFLADSKHFNIRKYDISIKKNS